ncbi:LacI family DNA-binding transcriptional regulator [Agromyces mangrovi Wang et al. 2018]|uniref:LacI family DNA-binding transcriptional regulator n=1 Tax=Agromyces mangrovi TaxID=1858653 RepID=UPI002573510B|nr:LacI family DNA-binding transcriptional regulator [Agromyces mangrovi]BDZ64936.1 LacI family transcriptional regulator [Agromyces mangrovi]
MTQADAAGATPTLEMVAARAGVSRATVSRVVNGSPKVTPEIVEAVQAAIAELNYVPNRAARSLASRRTHAIALVVPESTARVFNDPFFATLVQGVALALSDTEYTLSMLMESEQAVDKTRRYLLGGNVDGALVVSHHTGDHSYAHVSRSLPVVFGGRPLDPAERVTHTVDVDNAHGAELAARHLIARGGRRIATIAGPQDMPPGVDRLAGWRRALQEERLADDLVEYGDFSPTTGAAAMRRLLDRGERIDGLFAANDQMAIGAYSAIREAGLSIPDDIAVVGFDDDNYAATAVPPLTTVHQPSLEMGTTMAKTLVRLIEGDDVEPTTLLSTELVLRASA